MKDWLKWLIVGVCILAIVGGTLAIVFAVRAKNKGEESSDGIVKYSQVEFKDTFDNGESTAWFRAYAVGENQFTKISYKIDNQPEVKINNAKYGVASEDWDEYRNNFQELSYIDSTQEVINLSELEAGKHIIQVFVYAGSDARECICEKIFTIK